MCDCPYYGSSEHNCILSTQQKKTYKINLKDSDQCYAIAQKDDRSSQSTADNSCSASSEKSSKWERISLNGDSDKSDIEEENTETVVHTQEAKDLQQK